MVAGSVRRARKSVSSTRGERYLKRVRVHAASRPVGPVELENSAVEGFRALLLGGDQQMGKFSFDGHRTQRPRVGGVLAMALGAATTLAASKSSKPRLLPALNLGALLVRQYEEHEDPGWFPGQVNHGGPTATSPAPIRPTKPRPCA